MSHESSKDNDPVLRPARAAEALSLKPSTLAKMRMSGTGPEFIKLTKKLVGYKLSAIEAYKKSRTCRSTSETLPKADEKILPDERSAALIPAPVT